MRPGAAHGLDQIRRRQPELRGEACGAYGYDGAAGASGFCFVNGDGGGCGGGSGGGIGTSNAVYAGGAPNGPFVFVHSPSIACTAGIAGGGSAINGMGNSGAGGAGAAGAAEVLCW